MKHHFNLPVFNGFLSLAFFILLVYSCSNKEPQVRLEYAIKSQLGEGALWNYKTGELYWVDIEDKKFNIYNPTSKINKSFDLPSRVGTVVPFSANQAVLALEDGIYKISLSDGTLNRISDIEANMPLNRFNDGKCDPLGNLWVGSMHLEQSAPEASLYKVSPEGIATRMLDNITISNGIVWTQDAKTMYYIDTPTGNIRAFDYNDTTATITNERIAVKVDPDLGYPDGMTIDSDDNLWVGLWNGGAVAQFDPVRGTLLQKVQVPAHNVTAAAFGGPDFKTLYITTASVDMTPEEQTQFPEAGSVFSVIIPGVKGVKANFFGQ